MKGATLVELLVACALGLLVCAAAARALLSASAVARVDRSLAQIDSELQFAFAQLGRDLERSGYWAGASPAWLRTEPVAIADCGSLATLSLVVSAAGPSSATAANERFPCVSRSEWFGGVRGTGTDVLALKSAAPQALAAASRRTGYLYLAPRGGGALLFQQPSAGVDGPAYAYEPTVWYLRRYSVSIAESPPLPALCRKVLAGDGTGARMQADTSGCIAQGIEDLQLALGIDDDRNGVADYTLDVQGIVPDTVLRRAVRVDARITARALEPDPRYEHATVRDHYRRRTATRSWTLRNVVRGRAPAGIP